MAGTKACRHFERAPTWPPHRPIASADASGRRDCGGGRLALPSSVEHRFDDEAHIADRRRIVPHGDLVDIFVDESYIEIEIEIEMDERTASA